jgi:hypothetical protein
MNRKTDLTKIRKAKLQRGVVIDFGGVWTNYRIQVSYRNKPPFFWKTYFKSCFLDVAEERWDNDIIPILRNESLPNIPR